MKNLGNMANGIIRITSDVSNKSKESIISAIDKNGNGEIDIEDMIILRLRIPGIRVNRCDFLKKELMKNYTQEVIDDVIAYNPAHARIPSEEIDKIADEVIKYERNCVSGISSELGAPGGVAMVATIPASLRKTNNNSYHYHFYITTHIEACVLLMSNELRDAAHIP